MTDETNTGPVGQTTTGTAQDQGQTSQSTKDGKTDLATLPADVQELIRNLRAEAKDHRLAKEEAESKVQELTDNLEAAQAASNLMSEEAEKAARALTIRNLRDKFGLDDKAEKFLTGATDEELEEQAEALSAFATPQKNDDDQGTGGNAGGLQRTTDPAQQGQEAVDEDAARAAAFFGG